jgi:hypothetical protein
MNGLSVDPALSALMEDPFWDTRSSSATAIEGRGWLP